MSASCQEHGITAKQSAAEASLAFLRSNAAKQRPPFCRRDNRKANLRARTSDNGASVNSDTCTTYHPGTLQSSGVPNEPHLQDNESAVTALGPAAQGNQNGSDGFISVQRRRRPQPSVETGANSKLSAAPRPPRCRALFVSSLHPSTTCDDVANIVNSAVRPQFCVCTKLTTKHESCSSFHVSVGENDLDKIRNADLWLAGSLFRPFISILKPSSDTPGRDSMPPQSNAASSPLGS